MSVVSIVLSEEDHAQLEDGYRKMTVTWQQLGHKTLPPTFEQWLGQRTVAVDAALPDAELDDMRIFNAIEKLVTGLHQHGFGLAHIGKQGLAPLQAASDMAHMIVSELGLQPHYAKRIQDLFEHYLKSGKEIADAAQVGVTNRAYGALHEALRQLIERTENAAPHLGNERAIGRVEGAAAILVSLDAMERDSAKKKTADFKARMRTAARPTWMEKVFGGAADKE